MVGGLESGNRLQGLKWSNLFELGDKGGRQSEFIRGNMSACADNGHKRLATAVVVVKNCCHLLIRVPQFILKK